MTRPLRTHTGSRPGLSRGFSLIETVIALGIMGLAVTALLGLLPHGMEMSRKAATSGAVSRIMDSVKSDLSHFKFSNLANLGARERMFFDDEGVALDGNEAAALASYVAEITNMRTGGRNVTLPGGGIERNLITFRVRVANTPQIAYDFEANDPSAYTTMSMHFGPIVP
jgi:uncharacterized protein (TIGR02598 family)